MAELAARVQYWVPWVRSRDSSLAVLHMQRKLETAF